MAKYSVHAFCDECGGVHPTGIALSLDDGPADKSSIGDAYAGQDLPTSLATVTENRFPCPETKQLTSQKDNQQVFLVPVGG